MNQTEILWGVLFLLTFFAACLIHKKLMEKDVWHQIIRNYKENARGKLLSEARFISKYGAIENKSLVYKMDRLVLTSGVKKIFPWMNGEALLAGMGIATILGFVEGIVFAGNVLLSVFLAAAQTAALFIVFKFLSGRTYNKIEDGTPIFVSILSNHAKGSNDIVTIMENTKESLTGPLRDITERFVSDSETTGNTDIAFDYMKESVDNRQLQTIIVNLKNCSHYQANYEEVLVQMMGQIASSMSAREDRKNILFSSKLTLIVISITAAIIMWIIGAGLGIDVKGILTGNLAGQIILLLTGLLYLMVGVKMFGTDK